MGYRKGAQIGIDTQYFFTRRKGCAGKHLGDARGLQRFLTANQVITDHAGHSEAQPLFGDDLAQRSSASLGIDAARIGDDLDAALGDY